MFWINYILYRNNQSQIWVNEEKSMILYTEGSQLDEVGIIVGGGGVEILVGGVGVWEVGRLKWRSSRKFSSWHFTNIPPLPPIFFYIFVLSLLEFLFHWLNWRNAFKRNFQEIFSFYRRSKQERMTFNGIHEINKTNYHTRHIKPILALKITSYAITENNSNFQRIWTFC